MSNRISNNSAIINIIVSTLGSGITMMPAVFNVLGFFNAASILVAISLLTMHSLYSLGFSANQTAEATDEAPTYEKIGSKFSKFLSQSISFALILSSLAAVFSFSQMLVRLVIQALRFIPALDKYLDDSNSANSNYILITRIAILTTLCFLYFFLFQLKDLSSLSFFSKLSLAIVSVFSAFIIIYGIFFPLKDVSKGKFVKKMSQYGGIGTTIFALHCQFSFLSIFNSLNNKSNSNLFSVTLIASIGACILYSAVGYFGNRAFGDLISNLPIIISFGSVDSDLMKAMKNELGQTLGVLFPRMISVVYIPIFFSAIIFNLFPVIPIIQDLFKFNGERASRAFAAFIGSIYVFASSIYNIESLDIVLGLIGSALTLPLSFLFPAIFSYKCSKPNSFLSLVSLLIIDASFISMFVLIFFDLNKIYSEVFGKSNTGANN